MFYPHIARKDYNTRTGNYIPLWKKLARVRKDIKISDIDWHGTSFGPYAPAYVATNEDWRFAMHELNPAGKSVLTVAASGDQPIAFQISGARDIDTFDSTYFAKVIMDIKTSALQTMDCEQYKNMITKLRNARSEDDIPNYDKIKTVCPPETLNVVRQMNGCRIFAQGTGIRDEYLPNDKEYDAAKKIVNKPIRFMWSDLDNLHTVLNKKYDLIYLSNIFEYYHDTNKITQVLNNLYPFLNDGGEIMLFTSWVHNNTSEMIVDGAVKCTWGKLKSHEIRNAVMLTMTRVR
jgi:hypothetical protein